MLETDDSTWSAHPSSAQQQRNRKRTSDIMAAEELATADTSKNGAVAPAGSRRSDNSCRQEEGGEPSRQRRPPAPSQQRAKGDATTRDHPAAAVEVGEASASLKTQEESVDAAAKMLRELVKLPAQICDSFNRGNFFQVNKTAQRFLRGNCRVEIKMGGQQSDDIKISSIQDSLLFLKDLENSIPDGVYQIKSINVKKYTKSSRRDVICDFTFVGTQIRDVVGIANNAASSNSSSSSLSFTVNTAGDSFDNGLNIDFSRTSLIDAVGTMTLPLDRGGKILAVQVDFTTAYSRVDNAEDIYSYPSTTMAMASGSTVEVGGEIVDSGPQANIASSVADRKNKPQEVFLANNNGFTAIDSRCLSEGRPIGDRHTVHARRFAAHASILTHLPKANSSLRKSLGVSDDNGNNNGDHSRVNSNIMNTCQENNSS